MLQQTIAQTSELFKNISVGRAPNIIAFNPNSGYVYVTNTGNGSISVIDSSTNSVNATISVGLDPNGVAFNPNNGYAYVTNVF